MQPALYLETMQQVSCPWGQFSAPVQLITGTLSPLKRHPFVRGEDTWLADDLDLLQRFVRLMVSEVSGYPDKHR
jgi:hypothetical protein